MMLDGRGRDGSMELSSISPDFPAVDTSADVLDDDVLDDDGFDDDALDDEKPDSAEGVSLAFALIVFAPQ